MAKKSIHRHFILINSLLISIRKSGRDYSHQVKRIKESYTEDAEFDPMLRMWHIFWILDNHEEFTIISLVIIG